MSNPIKDQDEIKDTLRLDILNMFRNLQYPELDCDRCGKRFTTAKGQLIFYNLCNECFALFDHQKMWGRLKDSPGIAELMGFDLKWRTYARTFEDVRQWMKYEKEQNERTGNPNSTE